MIVSGDHNLPIVKFFDDFYTRVNDLTETSSNLNNVDVTLREDDYIIDLTHVTLLRHKIISRKYRTPNPVFNFYHRLYRVTCLSNEVVKVKDVITI